MQVQSTFYETELKNERRQDMEILGSGQRFYMCSW